MIFGYSSGKFLDRISQESEFSQSFRSINFSCNFIIRLCGSFPGSQMFQGITYLMASNRPRGQLSKGQSPRSIGSKQKSYTKQKWGLGLFFGGEDSFLKVFSNSSIIKGIGPWREKLLGETNQSLGKATETEVNNEVLARGGWWKMISYIRLFLTAWITLKGKWENNMCYFDFYLAVFPPRQLNKSSMSNGKPEPQMSGWKWLKARPRTNTY